MDSKVVFLIGLLLILLSGCISSNFTGSSPDENTEAVGTIVVGKTFSSCFIFRDAHTNETLSSYSFNFYITDAVQIKTVIDSDVFCLEYPLSPKYTPFMELINYEGVYPYIRVNLAELPRQEEIILYLSRGPIVSRLEVVDEIIWENKSIILPIFEAAIFYDALENEREEYCRPKMIITGRFDEEKCVYSQSNVNQTHDLILWMEPVDGFWHSSMEIG